MFEFFIIRRIFKRRKNKIFAQIPLDSGLEWTCRTQKMKLKNAGTGHSQFNTGVEHSTNVVPANRLKGLGCL
jgi:hypothetical protein